MHIPTSHYHHKSHNFAILKLLNTKHNSSKWWIYMTILFILVCPNSLSFPPWVCGYLYSNTMQPSFANASSHVCGQVCPYGEVNLVLIIPFFMSNYTIFYCSQCSKHNSTILYITHLSQSSSKHHLCLHCRT